MQQTHASNTYNYGTQASTSHTSHYSYRVQSAGTVCPASAGNSNYHNGPQPVRDIPRRSRVIELVNTDDPIRDRCVTLVHMHMPRQHEIHTVRNKQRLEHVLAAPADLVRYVCVSELPRPVPRNDDPRRR